MFPQETHCTGLNLFARSLLSELFCRSYFRRFMMQLLMKKMMKSELLFNRVTQCGEIMLSHAFEIFFSVFFCWSLTVSRMHAVVHVVILVDEVVLM